MTDPTTASIEAAAAEREQLRAEVARLERALVAAYTEIETIKADRDRLAKQYPLLGEAQFDLGYDQAVCEIRDHFKKASWQNNIAAEIEKIWIQEKS